MRIALAAALLLVAAPALAQAPAPTLHGTIDRAAITAGSYAVEPGHTQINFAVSHMGFTPFAGTFSDASGTLTLDPKKPNATTLTVTLPIASVQTTSAKLTDELKAADWFDAAKFPTATFRSTAVRSNGDGAEIAGTLTLHGVTRPVTIRARLFGAGNNPMSKAATVGFVGRAFIKRSEFGVSKYVPVVSDDVELIFNAAFERR